MGSKLTLKNISKTFVKKKNFFSSRGTKVCALENLSLVMEGKNVYGVVGVSGCGKTTLGRIVLGLEDADQGELWLDDTLIMKNGQRCVKRSFDFQCVFQNPFSSLNPRLTMFDVLAEGLQCRGVSRARITKKVYGVLDEVHLPAAYVKKYSRELSGGELQRIAIARALLVEPKVLVMDEPISSLDVSKQAVMLRVIESIIAQRDILIIFISHDLASVREIAEYMFVLCDGKLVEENDTESLFFAPQHSYTQKLIKTSTFRSAAQ